MVICDVVALPKSSSGKAGAKLLLFLKTAVALYKNCIAFYVKHIANLKIDCKFYKKSIFEVNFSPKIDNFMQSAIDKKFTFMRKLQDW